MALPRRGPRARRLRLGARIPLTSDTRERATSNVRMHRIGSRLVLMWIWGTGGLSPLVHHRVQVVETTSAM